MEPKPQKQLKLLNSYLRSIEESVKTKLKSTKNQLNRDPNDHTLNLQQIKDKTSALWERGNNPKTEIEFRQICLFYNENPTSSPELIEAFQEYAKTYHKVTSLYLFNLANNRNELIIYNTENESTEIKVFDTPDRLDDQTAFVQLPNGKMFCVGNTWGSRNAWIIDNDYNVRRLSSGASCSHSSTIYFNKNVYCFGGLEGSTYLTFSSRFDLDQNRWVKLSPIPTADAWCTSVIYNGNILFSGYWNQNLLIYSIDLNSFSTIPYVFPANNKRLISTADRLYLLGFNKKLVVYESEDKYSWKKIAKMAIPTWPIGRYYRYNKGGIYNLIPYYKSQWAYRFLFYYMHNTHYQAQYKSLYLQLFLMHTHLYSQRLILQIESYIVFPLL